MVFNSFAFLIFFPTVLLLYRIIPLKYRWTMLLIVSYYFYMGWQPDLVYLISFTTIISYLCGIGIEKAKSQKTKKALMVITFVVCLSVLFFFKYFNFLAENAVNLLNFIGLQTSEFSLKLILPVGISFYTFQTLSYVVDVYRGTFKAERHFGYYALYVSFFPQLVAGPIERPENLIPQLKTKNPFSADETAMGLKIMMAGFFKKIVVADQISKYVDAVYNSVDTGNSQLINGFTVIVATVLFAIQIYCDFSGYTDIAIGCARCMGIRLMQNFRDPYSATSIKDFWRRWHISLSSWFSDYVYIPLGGSRCSRIKHYRNLMIVFLISGMWHGAAWTFILWGGLHGAYQLIGNITAKPRSLFWAKLRVDEKGRIMTWMKRAVTFILVCFAWIAFRANSLDNLRTLVLTLFKGWSGFSLSSSFEALGISLLSGLTIIISVFMIKMLDKQINLRSDVVHADRGVSIQRANAYLYICWTIAVAWLILLGNDLARSFIYFQF